MMLGHWPLVIRAVLSQGTSSGAVYLCCSMQQPLTKCGYWVGVTSVMEESNFTFTCGPWWFIWQRILLQCGRPRFEPLEKGLATHSSILAWRIPWTEKPGGLQSMERQRVGHDWETNTCTSLILTCHCMWLVATVLMKNYTARALLLLKGIFPQPSCS